MRKIVFYSESDEFGGHEKMALAAHAAIQKHRHSMRIHWVVSKRNVVLTDALEKAGIEYTALLDSEAHSRVRKTFKALGSMFSNAVKLRRLAPDLVMVIQGNIVLSYRGILSSFIGRLRCCSYIPMMFHASGIKRDRLRIMATVLLPLLYKTIPSYITIDEELAKRLRRESPKASIVVVENYIPKSELLDAQRDAKDILGIPAARKVLALIGRIAFEHKCQDWVLQVLRDDAFLADKFVLFVGDGPDRQALQAMLTPELRDRFGLIGWRSNLRDIYAATDVLIIPSKNEGVPLVMLEALSYRVPVVGSDQDGMRSWLPAQWRFTWGDTEGFKRGVEQAIAAASPAVWAGFAKRLEHVHDESRFASEFSHALSAYSVR